MNRLFGFAFLSILGCLGLLGTAAAAPVILPPPVLPFAMQHDDFYSYSARVISALGIPGFNGPTGTGGLDVLVYTGAAGQTNLGVGTPPVYTFPAPLAAPSGGQIGFGEVWGPNDPSTGPATVDSLLAYLHSTFGPTVNTPVFNFDLNQTGQNPNLLILGDVRIRDAADTVIADWSLDAVTNGVFDQNAWLPVPGEITIPNPFLPGQFITVDNNLGSGKLDFILVPRSLNLADFAGAGNTIEFDFRLLGLNGGFEEAFLTGAFQPGVSAPEPGTLLLMGIGALGAAALRRRAKNAAQ